MGPSACGPLLWPDYDGSAGGSHWCLLGGSASLPSFLGHGSLFILEAGFESSSGYALQWDLGLSLDVEQLIENRNSDGAAPHEPFWWYPDLWPRLEYRRHRMTLSHLVGTFAFHQSYVPAGRADALIPLRDVGDNYIEGDPDSPVLEVLGLCFCGDLNLLWVDGVDHALCSRCFRLPDVGRLSREDRLAYMMSRFLWRAVQLAMWRF